MRRMFTIGTLLSALCVLPASAILDTISNGLSDLWERAYNGGELFPTTAFPHRSGDDPDGDGWTNEQEASAGTNPFDPNPPDGLVRPMITHIPELLGETPEAITITWPTIVGKQYTLMVSPDLVEWLPVDSETLIGNGDPIEYGMTLPEYDKLFWRVKVEDVDSDGDGLTDAEEMVLGTDPSQAETIAGYPDLWLAQNYLDILLNGGLLTIDPDGDPDSDGLTNAQEDALGTDRDVADNPGISQESIINGDFSGPVIGHGKREGTANATWDYWEGLPDANRSWTASHGTNIEFQVIEATGTNGQYCELKAHPENHYGIKQQVGTRIGVTYLLAFDCKVRQNTTAYNNIFTIKITGVADQSITPTSTWANQVVSFVATTVLTEIKLVPKNGLDDTMGCLVDNVKLAPLEVVNNLMKPVTELKVAKMTDSEVLSCNGTLNPDKDTDRFYIRITGAACLGATTVKLGTINNPDASYNDAATELDLTVSGGDLVSKSLLLVSDDTDDNIAIDSCEDNEKNDRTYKIQLTGKLKISAIKIGNNSEQIIDKSVPVNVKKTVKLKMANCQYGLLFHDPCWSDELVASSKKVLKERYAQIGVMLDIADASGPDVGVYGWVDDYPSLVNGVLNIPDETKDILNASPSPKADEITAYLVVRLGDSGHLSHGVSLAPKYLNSADKTAGYGNRLFVSNSSVGYAHKFTASHELLHILLDAAHGDYTTNDQMLFQAPTSDQDSIDATKRIPNNQQQKIYNNPLAK
jgi:hypothetical protein